MEHSHRKISPTPPPSNYARFVNSHPNIHSNGGRSGWCLHQQLLSTHLYVLAPADTVSVNVDNEGRPYAVLGDTRVWSQTSAHYYQG
jgi:hypothetical protein